MDAPARCTASAPTAAVASACCSDSGAPIYTGLLEQLRQIAARPMREAFAPSAIRDTVRLVGLQSPMTRAEFGEEINWLVERRLSNGSRPVRPSTLRTVAKTDAFGTAAMGMWQIPAQFSCMVHTLRSALGGAVRRAVVVGTWSGWTDLVLQAYTQRLNPSVQYTTFDIRNHVSACISALHAHHGLQSVHNGWFGGKESWGPLGLMDGWTASGGHYPAEWPEPVLDLCFIDGGHSYYLANRDFKTMRSACRVIVFHDVVNKAVGWNNVPMLWRDLTDPAGTKYAAEFWSKNCTQQGAGASKAASAMGIGVLVRRDLDLGS